MLGCKKRGDVESVRMGLGRCIGVVGEVKGDVGKCVGQWGLGRGEM